MSIPSSFIDRLLSTVSIVDIINRRVQLERSGGRYKANVVWSFANLEPPALPAV